MTTLNGRYLFTGTMVTGKKKDEYTAYSCNPLADRSGAKSDLLLHKIL